MPNDRGGTAREYRRLAAIEGVTDYLCVLAAMLIAYLIRFNVNPSILGFVAVMVVAPPLFIAVFAAFRLYGVYRFAPAEEFRRVVFAVAVGFTGVIIWSYWTKSDLSRLWVGLSWMFSMLLVLVTRRIWHHYVWSRQRRGSLTFRTVIVGGNDEAAHLAGVMRGVPSGFEAVGFVATDVGTAVEGEVEGIDGLPRLGSLAQLDDIIVSAGAECLFAASSALRGRDMAVVTKAARTAGVEVRISANIPELLSTRLSAQPLGGVMAFSVWPVRLTGLQAATKRTFDLLVGAPATVLALVLWVPIAAVIKLGSRGPVIYRQRRVGRHGREFTMLKFRTMTVGSERSKPENSADGPLFKSPLDPRVTGVGRSMRRWSIDELPQFINVVRGDMSLVGPRPPLPEEVVQYEDWQRDRLEVRPGITGLWQVSGRSDLSFDDYVRLDLFYIENWSLAYDLYLLAKTIPAVLSGRGAF